MFILRIKQFSVTRLMCEKAKLSILGDTHFPKMNGLYTLGAQLEQGSVVRLNLIPSSNT